MGVPRKRVSMNRLPDEVLCMVFGYLPVSDLLNGIRPVCRRFCRLASELCVDRVLFNMTYRSCHPRLSSSAAAILASSCTAYKHFRIDRDCTRNWTGNGWERETEEVVNKVVAKVSKAESLILVNEDDEATVGRFIKGAAATLKSLTLLSCDFVALELDWVIADGGVTFPNLTHFGAEFLRHMSNQILARVLNAAPNLRSLSLRGTWVTLPAGRLARRGTNSISGNFPSPPEDRGYISSNLNVYNRSGLTAVGAVRIIRKFGPGITSLNLAKMPIGRRQMDGVTTLEALCSRNGKLPVLNLEYLDLGRRPRLLLQEYEMIVRTFKELKAFKTAAWPSSIDFGFVLQCLESQSLLELSLRCPIDGEVAGSDGSSCVDAVLQRNQQLQRLVLTNISDPQIASILNMRLPRQLTSLELGDVAMCEGDWKRVLESLSSQCVGLRVITFRHLSNFTDNVLQVLLARFVKLQALSLINCDKLTDSGFIGVEALESDCRLRLNERFREAKDEAPLKNLKGLVVLSVANCRRITDAFLRYALDHPSLEFIDISHTGVTNAGVSALKRTAKSLLELRVNKRLKKGITAEGLKKFVDSAKRLRRLSSSPWNVSQWPEETVPVEEHLVSVVSVPKYQNHQRKLLQDASVSPGLSFSSDDSVSLLSAYF